MKVIYCLKVGLIGLVLSGCIAATKDSSSSSLKPWNQHKTRHSPERLQAFQEYKEQKKEERQKLHAIFEKIDDSDHAKELMVGWIDCSVFFLTATLVPLYADKMFSTPTYMIEGYALEIPLGESR